MCRRRAMTHGHLRDGLPSFRRSNRGNLTTMNLPDALKNISDAVTKLSDAIEKAEADPNLPPIADDLKTAGKDLVTAVGDIL